MGLRLWWSLGHSGRFLSAFFFWRGGGEGSRKPTLERLELRHPQPPTGGFGPFGPEVSRGVSERVSPKIGVSEKVSGGVSRRAFGPRAPECPKGVPRVSLECPDTFFTLRRHSLDTFWTLLSLGPEGPPRHSPGHSLGHPDFRGHSLGHSPDTSGPKGPM